MGLVETVNPVRTRPRRNQLSQRGTGGAKRLQLPQKLRQLGDIHGDPPRPCRMYAGRRHPTPSTIESVDQKGNLIEINFFLQQQIQRFARI